jgi:hypothetical protein
MAYVVVCHTQTLKAQIVLRAIHLTVPLHCGCKLAHFVSKLEASASFRP